MSNFEFGPQSSGPSKKAESFENQSHLILRNPIEIDLDQPDRADEYLMELLTGQLESKLIAEITTPTDHISVVNTKFPNLYPVIFLMRGSDGSRRLINPGEVIFYGDKGHEDSVIISLDEEGTRMFVNAVRPDPGYQIYTQELELHKIPSYEECVDDPELDLPYTAG